MVRPVMDQVGCAGRDPDCLTPAETGVEISARTFDSNSLGDKVGEGHGSEHRHAGHWRKLAFAYMWRIHMETGPRRVEEVS